MSQSLQLDSKNSLSLLVLGTGEIARTLVSLAEPLDYPVTVCDPQVNDYPWPSSVTLINKNFNTEPFVLPAGTHAVIARAHEEDELSVLNLLQHDAERVYLIASAKRAQAIIDHVMPKLNQPGLLKHLSAPAGLELGGNSSEEISLSILAEIQWRYHRSSASLQPLTDLRASRLTKSTTGQRDQNCPGKRP